MIERARNAWLGREQAWVVFWGFEIGLGIALSLVLVALAVAINLPIVSLLFDALAIAFWVFILICAWRCAFNLRHRFWGWLLRGHTILTALYMVGVSLFLLEKDTQPIHMTATTLRSVIDDGAAQELRKQHPFHQACEREVFRANLRSNDEQQPDESFSEYLERSAAADEKVYEACIEHREAGSQASS